MKRLVRLGGDALLIILATALAIMVRSDLQIYSADFLEASTYIAATLVIGILAIGVSRLDLGVWRFASVEDVIRIMIVAAATVIGAVMIAFTINRLSGVARSVPIFQFVLIATFLLLPRLIARARHRVRRKIRPFNALTSAARSEEQVLLVGMGPLAETFLRSLTEIGSRIVRVVGIVSPGSRLAQRRVQNYKVLGTLSGLDGVIQTLSMHGGVIDRIVVALPPHEVSQEIREQLAQLGDRRKIEIDYLAERLL